MLIKKVNSWLIDEGLKGKHRSWEYPFSKKTAFFDVITYFNWLFHLFPLSLHNTQNKKIIQKR